jgi:hypothetical protein
MGTIRSGVARNGVGLDALAHPAQRVPYLPTPNPRISIAQATGPIRYTLLARMSQSVVFILVIEPARKPDKER